MLYLYVLVQRTLRTITLLTRLHATPIVPLYLTRSPPESLLAIILSLLSSMDVLALLLEFGESGGELVAFVEELAHLGEEDSVGEVEATVFVVVGEVVIFFGLLHLVVTIDL